MSSRDCEIHPELKDASLDKACELANKLVESFDSRQSILLDKGQLAFDLSYMLEYLRLNFDITPKSK
jgi:hypothetical protein